MTIKFNHRFFIFPPWYVYNAIKNSENRSGKLSYLEYFFILWMTCQWLLIFSSHRNVLLGVITANIALWGLIVSNIYSYLDVRMLSESEQSFLEALPVKIITAFSVIAFMYMMAGIPKIALEGIERYYNINLYFSSFIWTSYHVVIKYLLIFLWIFPVSLRLDKLFESFPREHQVTNYKLKFVSKIFFIAVNLLLCFIYFVLQPNDIVY